MPLLTDITPLRETPAFRRLWLGSMLSQTGSAMTTFAISLQAYDLTHSTAEVGGIGLASFLPMLVIALPGGTLADRVDRRRLVLVMTACQAAVSAALFAIAQTAGTSGADLIWALYGLTAISSALSAISAPARRTFIPRIVPAEQWPAALALNRIVFQVMLIGGPSLAGVVTGAFGLRGCYLVDLVTFAGSLWSTFRLPAMSPETTPAAPKGGPSKSGLALTLEGLSFIRRTPVLCGAFLADVNATFFGLPTALFPAINAERFGGDPRTLGLFTAAIGVGGLISAMFTGPLRSASRHGLTMLACVSVWGGAFALFAVAPSLWLTLLALALAGLADTFTVVIRGLIVQAATPEAFLGRVNAADYLVGAGGGQLGSLEAGLVGAWTTPEISALTGGLITIAGALAIGAALPGFRRFKAVEPGAPGGEKPAEEQPAEEQTAEEKPAEEKPAAEQPAAEQPAPA